ncbi:SDR family NAD(P)-dependent oxidoreductase [Niveispirillum sp. BGYR6]|uniref:SDR family NAD(P)-dependent oxidoreductase n=1 Tax=Niveispirillum sp. BGYR6 TaxID=2971249 RepID=UPI0022B9595A|nr:SDR family NAD(P)-dependent oxidoreductase [Niveispirillum sp. BGYR6]MDG5493289.1 SDR family NAD(P)-dependent oxidoreductase [Niveispirillum sp. BGYR6]
MVDGADGLRGKVALVTGATSGLGLRFAQVLAGHGVRVALMARRRDRMDAIVAEITAQGGTAVAIPLDVSRVEDFADAVTKAETALGPVDFLVNNAGVPDAKLATKMQADHFDHVMSVNVRAPFLLSAEVARRLMASKRPGRIVNIASMAAYHCPMPGMALYAVTKSALVRMTEALAVELAVANINVNAIAPGAFASEMMDGMLQRMGDITRHFPRRRLGEPSGLDSTLLYLLSDASAYVTGTCIKVDDAQYPR